MQVSGLKPALFRRRPLQQFRGTRAGRAGDEGRSRRHRPCRLNRLPLEASGLPGSRGGPPRAVAPAPALPRPAREQASRRVTRAGPAALPLPASALSVAAHASLPDAFCRTGCNMAAAAAA